MFVMTRMYRAIQSAIQQIYSATNSMRVNSSASSMLTGTLLNNSNPRVQVHSMWVKRSAFNVAQTLFGALSGSNYTALQFSDTSNNSAGDRLSYIIHDVTNNQSVGGYTNMYFRDPNAWYHILFAYDSTQPNMASRVMLIVNGVLASTNALGGTNNGINTPLDFNVAGMTLGATVAVGAYPGNSRNFTGYISDYTYIDGYPSGISQANWSIGALTALFGTFTNGMWVPKQYTGRYGPNGFFQNFTASNMLGRDAAGSVQATLDPYWDSTLINLSFDGNLNDSATGRHATNGGGVSFEDSSLSTSSGKCAVFNGTSSAFLSIPGSADMNCTINGDATVELSVYLTSYGNGTVLYKNGSGGGDISVNTNGTVSWSGNTSSSTVSLNAWHHIALVRSNNIWKLYIDGKQDSTTSSTGLAWFSGDVWIGKTDGATQYYINGKIDNFRFTRAARYTGIFDAPTTSPALGGDPHRDYVVIGTHFDASPSFELGSSPSISWLADCGGHAVIPSVGAFSTPDSRFGKTSLSLNGTSNIKIPLDVALNTSADFTIELWGKFVTPSRILQIQNGSSTNASYSFALGTASGKYTAQVISGTVGYAVPSSGLPAIPLNVWTHVAVVKQGTSLSLFQDGVLVGSTSCPASINNVLSNGYVVIGTDLDGTGGTNALIDELRISTTARYTTTFTPATVAHVTDVDTWALLHFETPWSDVSEKLPTMYGNAQLSPSNKVFGTHSLYVDGTLQSRAKYAASSDFKFTNDFTIEYWFNPSVPANAGDHLYFGAESYGGGTALWVGTNSSSTAKVAYYVGGSNIFTMTPNIGANLVAGTWYHLALVRRGSGLALFINGSQIGTSTYSGTIDLSSLPLSVGFGWTTGAAANPWRGHIDDLRITNGVARYVGSFIPPTHAFSDVTAKSQTNLTAVNVNIIPRSPSDQMIDTPNNNFCTLNPLGKGINAALSAGNLGYNNTSNNFSAVGTTIAISTGKWYWEVNTSGTGSEFGLAYANTTWSTASYTNATYNLARYSCFNGKKRIGNGALVTYDAGGATPAGTILGFAADLDVGTLTVYRNGTSLGVLHSWTPTGIELMPHADYSASSTGVDHFNFGQQPQGTTFDAASGGFFKYIPPAGFKAICTANM